MERIFDDAGPCHVHDAMRLKKPHLKDSLPIHLCLLCDRAFCVDHKGMEEGVCEINHETYYRKHSAAQKYLYRTYEDWKSDHKQMMVDETSGDEREVVVGRKEKDGKAKVAQAKEDGKQMDTA